MSEFLVIVSLRNTLLARTPCPDADAQERAFAQTIRDFGGSMTDRDLIDGLWSNHDGLSVQLASRVPLTLSLPVALERLQVA